MMSCSACFFAVIFLPWLVLRFTDPDTVRYRLFPRKFRWLDVGYVAISIPVVTVGLLTGPVGLLPAGIGSARSPALSVRYRWR